VLITQKSYHNRSAIITANVSQVVQHWETFQQFNSIWIVRTNTTPSVSRSDRAGIWDAAVRVGPLSSDRNTGGHTEPMQVVRHAALSNTPRICRSAVGQPLPVPQAPLLPHQSSHRRLLIDSRLHAQEHYVFRRCGPPLCRSNVWVSFHTMRSVNTVRNTFLKSSLSILFRLPRFPLLRFPPLQSGATFSTPAISASPITGPLSCYRSIGSLLNKWIKFTKFMQKCRFYLRLSMVCFSSWPIVSRASTSSMLSLQHIDCGRPAVHKTLSRWFSSKVCLVSDGHQLLKK